MTHKSVLKPLTLFNTSSDGQHFSEEVLTNY